MKLDWYLKINDDHTDIGFWPHKIFTNLGQTATGVECGGEEFSPTNVPGPGMGSGHRLQYNTIYDAFCARTNVKVNNTIMNPPNGPDYVIDNDHFEVFAKGDVGGEVRYLIVYAGIEGVVT